MAFSLAIYDCLKSILNNQNLKIKWPNDLYVGDKKIAGILIQNTIRGTRLHNSILGVGINVNQKIFPDDIPNPSSVYIETNKTSELLPLQMTLHSFVEKRLEQLSVYPTSLSKTYTSLLYRLNEDAPFRHKDQLIWGSIIGVSAEGKLRVQLALGIQEFNFRELEYIISDFN
jgi:BirA family biotin operon repressor/biotin-[acetyl-CoA-carboxylase] ligase